MAECFWTDLQGATQECGSAPSGLLPNRDYYGIGDNGVMSVTWGYLDDLSNQVPYPMADGTLSLFYSGGQWNCLGGVQNYFPHDPADRVEATIQIYRCLRDGTYDGIFGSGSPSDIASWAELVDEIVVTDLGVAASPNGNILYKVTGVVPGVPDPDPQYQYMLVGAYNIYSPLGDLVHTEPYASGAMYDTGGEIPDGSGSVLPIKSVLPIVPVGFDPYDVGLVGYGVSYLYDYPNSEGVLIYTVGYWKGVMADFVCEDYVGTIDGGSPETITVQCS